MYGGFIFALWSHFCNAWSTYIPTNSGCGLLPLHLPYHCLFFWYQPAYPVMVDNSMWLFSLGEHEMQWLNAFSLTEWVWDPLFSAPVPWKLYSTVAFTPTKRSKGSSLPMNCPWTKLNFIFIDLICFDTIQTIIEW